MIHTGTRFTLKFFHDHGIQVFHRHVHEQMTKPEWVRILPVRSPYDCYRSWVRRRAKHMDDKLFISRWATYIFHTEQQDAFYFPLDIHESERVPMLKAAVEFIGEKPNMNYIRMYAKDWKRVSPSIREEDRVNDPFPEHMRELLRFADEWYDHYTKNWGGRIRNRQNVIGNR